MGPVAADRWCRAFSLMGQIHTISTPTALGLLRELLTEPVRPWDALICSSSAGRDVVQGVLDVREQQLLSRLKLSSAEVVFPAPVAGDPFAFTDGIVCGACFRHRRQTCFWIA